MSKHRQGDTAGRRNDAVVFDDALCDALSRGEDITAGQDPLAGLLLDVVRQVNEPMPAAPNLDELLPVEAACTTTFPAVTNITPVGAGEPPTAPSTDGPQDTATVIDLSARRHRRVGWLGPGLTGAAAATLVIAGGGAMIHGSEPGDALWGLNEAIFGNHAAVVKLASTLEEADTRNAEGDVQGALQLLEQAKAMAQKANARQDPPAQPKTRTVTVTKQAPAPEDATVTETTTAPPETTTVTKQPVTVTTSVVVTPRIKPSATNLAPGVKPTTQAVPLSAVMPSLENNPTASATRVSTEPIVVPEMTGEPTPSVQ